MTERRRTDCPRCGEGIFEGDVCGRCFRWEGPKVVHGFMFDDSRMVRALRAGYRVSRADYDDPGRLPWETGFRPEDFE